MSAANTAGRLRVVGTKRRPASVATASAVIVGRQTSKKASSAGMSAKKIRSVGHRSGVRTTRIHATTLVISTVRRRR